MTPSHLAGAIAPYTPLAVATLALLLMAVVLQDAFEVMLLPRRVHRRVRFTRFYFRTIWTAWTALSRWLPHAHDQRERFLAVFGPLSMLTLIAAWSTLLIAAFGLLQWVLQGQVQPHSAPLAQIYMSGVTFFTLGYGDVVPHSGAARAAAVIEAGTGLGFLAVVIGYLPVLYQLFSRREAHVIQLDARAGSPPTAGAMLIRHADGGLDKLDLLLREWEFWGADLLESHLSYPMLVYYRSQHDNQSWLAAVAAIMDTCALILVGIADMHPLQARMTFTIIRQVVVEMARSLAIPPSRYDGGDRLPPAAYARLQASFVEAGLAWDGDAHAHETLAALRATYEPLLDGLARKLLLPLPGWIPQKGATDNWQSGHRGTLAGRLVAQLAERQSGAPEAEPDDPLWRRLRTRLGKAEK
jgi:hypothetical protein